MAKKLHTNQKLAGEFARMEDCRSRYVYADLKDSLDLKVLLFEKERRFDLNYWPNFLIGITNLSDTIGIMDIEFKGDVKVLDRVRITPSKWVDANIDGIKPAVVVFSRENDKNLICSVKMVYRGKILIR